MVCVRLYADLRGETWALFATVDEARWASPPVLPLRGVYSRSSLLYRAGIGRQTRVRGRLEVRGRSYVRCIWLQPPSSRRRFLGYLSVESGCRLLTWTMRPLPPGHGFSR